MAWGGVRIVLVVVAAAVLAHPAYSSAQPTACLAAHRLTTEYLFDPLGIERATPRLAWQVASSANNQTQSAYQIQAASSQAALAAGKADLWDTGKVASSNTINVKYGGNPLASFQAVFWRVQSWNQDGVSCGWSESASWEMGVMDTKEWTQAGASWITQDNAFPKNECSLYDKKLNPIFRASFGVQDPTNVRKARAYVSGLGWYHMFIDGERVGDRYLEPGWTSYASRVLYSVHDVTDAIASSGKHTVGVSLGNGWINPVPLRLFHRINLRDYLTISNPRFILMLKVWYGNATKPTTTLVSNTSAWTTSGGCIVFNNVYLGSVIDNRMCKSIEGWSTNSYSPPSGAWVPPVQATVPLGPLQAQTAQPTRIKEVLKSSIRPMTIDNKTVYVVDLGRNFGGLIRINATGPAGTRIQLKYGELLFPNGTVNGWTSVAGQVKGPGQGGPCAPLIAFQRDEFILAGTSTTETFQTAFGWHGFRYAEVHGYPGSLSSSDVVGLVLHADVPTTGTFHSSNTLLNTINTMCHNTHLSNMMSLMQSDCPHRERLGYTGDMWATSTTAFWNWDMSSFYAKRVIDVGDAQRENGGITETAPFVGIDDNGLGNFSGPIGWDSAQPFLQVKLYEYYGNDDLMREAFNTTWRWIQFLEDLDNQNSSLIVDGLGDWMSVEKMPVEFTGEVFLFLNYKHVSFICTVLDKTNCATHYAAKASQVKRRINQWFLQEGGKYISPRVSGTSQCSQAGALYHNLTPNATVQAEAVSTLLANLAANGNHLMVGMYALKWLFLALSDHGHNDVAFEVATQTTYPSYGFMINNNATTLWEAWFFSNNTFSHNHPMDSSITPWFFQSLGGINQSPGSVAFSHIVVAPVPVHGLDFVNVTFHSLRGPISSVWKLSSQEFHLTVSIPANTVADVLLPRFTAGSRKVLRGRAGDALRVGSGEHVFMLQVPQVAESVDL